MTAKPIFWRTTAAGAALVMALLAGWAVGRLSARPGVPGEGSPEAGFARDMQVHHLQAVDMSMTVRDRTEDPEIGQLAYDVARSQQQQSGQMYGWLSVWGLPQAGSEPPMAWAGSSHGTHGGTGTNGTSGVTPMPGMATPQDLARLRQAEGTEAERLYLELMIEHHDAGVDMAEAILARTDDQAVTSLARSIATAQQSEIKYMAELLAVRR
ncbi:DUF305 domain-containing protein [Arthrobacter sp. KFRI-F3372]|uniref:DUF305 domain-containing protein n=1 Tax=Micrococcaceae TaxID=1268 RepID=UPI002787C2E8|nr:MULTISPECIES: DUF305 domain-containing protein [Micrococcaceae]MDP9988341.1 uncharacterized protein (DUF305 family) [Arthrobacter oryzae]MEE2523841.1 DUF305 domain-containing protein [Pseudarthrobacter sp. J47]MEE2530271.1 DUF305 domain-containing protein [Pseudarthrobacter sp. J75]WHP61011.1 DUF305 domain-containing protein [Arthrobacter sp. KFRI-F3372]